MPLEVNFNSSTGTPTDTFNYFSDETISDDGGGINLTVLAIISVVLILYYLIFASLGVSGGDNGTNEKVGKSVVFLEILIWGVFIVLLLLNGMQYFFNINIIATLKNLFSSVPEIDFKVETSEGDSSISQIKRVKQVFHIPGNKYTYDDSKAICQAYGSRLANYKEMEKAYKDGGDWCSYGWSEGQMAYFPTQYDKWKKLQTIKGHENDCGRTGINGGFIDNPNVRFGINCFGYKPKISSDEAEAMAETPLYPKTQEEIDFEHRVDYWKNKIPEIIVAPFNSNNWSVF